MSTHTRSCSGGSFPFTSPRIFCRWGGTSVRLCRAALRSKTRSDSAMSNVKVLPAQVNVSWIQCSDPTPSDATFGIERSTNSVRSDEVETYFCRRDIDRSYLSTATTLVSRGKWICRGIGFVIVFNSKPIGRLWTCMVQVRHCRRQQWRPLLCERCRVGACIVSATHRGQFFFISSFISSITRMLSCPCFNIHRNM